MKAASVKIAALDADVIQSIIDGSVISIDVEGKSVDLDTDKIIIERIEKANLKVLNEGTLTVALDTEITEELQLEGYARDFIRGVQNLRKESGLAVTDRIELTASGSAALKKAFEMFADFIAAETLAVKTVWADSLADGTEIPAGEENWKAVVKRA